MHRQRVAAAVLAGLIGIAGAIPALTPALTSAAAECGTYASESVPPSTIRVLRTVSGAVETVDFGAYVKNVLSREWISSWTTESLRSGALAVKHYAWYQVVHWRGYLNGAGECFDVFDSVRDQLYDPSQPTYAAMAAAVDATWGTLALRGGRLFPTYYNAGSAGEPCGANANGWQMHQWGTQACGLDGHSAAAIMAIYYSDVTVTDAPPVATPPPTPTPEPMPTPAPSAAPDPTPIPTPSPEPTPAPQPGGGQVDLVAPPPAPPPAPEPVVVALPPAAADAPPSVAPRPKVLDAIMVFEAGQDATRGGVRLHARAVSPLAANLRRMVLRSLIEDLIEDLGGWTQPAASGSRRRTTSSDAATSWMARPTLLKTVIASRSRVAE